MLLARRKIMSTGTALDYSCTASEHLKQARARRRRAEQVWRKFMGAADERTQHSAAADDVELQGCDTLLE